MSDDFFQNDQTTQPAQPDAAQDAFAAMEAAVSAAAPDGQYVTIRANGGTSVFAPMDEGEESLSISEAIQRADLTIGQNVNAYVEGSPVSFSTLVPARTVITLIGTVKGG